MYNALNQARPTISVVGAFDRHNYGDLLFPLIIERVVEDLGLDVELDYYATTNSRMSAYGGKDTKSIRQLFAKPASAGEKVLLAGGELLPAKWSLVISYLTSPLMAKVVNHLSKFAGDRLSSALISRWMGSRSELPFVYARSDFKRPISVHYNAVGGSHVKDESAYVRVRLLSKLHTAEHVSVRDQETFDFLKSNGIDKVRLAPDCAILVSRLYPIERLKQLVTPQATSLRDALPDGYICVQAGAAYSMGREAEFLTSIERIKRQTGLAVVVVAIGRAAGHSDQHTFNIFRSQTSAAGSPPTIISECDSVFDLMYLIASSKIFIGTSLHGAITSVSFGVPVLGLCPSRVNKLKAFLTTWVDAQDYQLAEFDQLDAGFDRLWANRRAGTSLKVSAAQATARENFRRLLLSEETGSQ